MPLECSVCGFKHPDDTMCAPREVSFFDPKVFHNSGPGFPGSHNPPVKHLSTCPCPTCEELKSLREAAKNFHLAVRKSFESLVWEVSADDWGALTKAEKELLKCLK